MTFGLDQDINSHEYQFPSLFKAHHQDYTADIPFWLNLARIHGGPILELGCGPGRILMQLVDAGYDCFGLDNHSGMLAQIKKGDITARSGQLNTLLADITGFQIQEHFPLIILPCNTYSTLEHSGRISALNCIHKHLTPGGVFAVSVPNPDILKDLDTSEEPEFEIFFPHPETKNPVQVSYLIVKEAERVLFHWHYDHLYPDGQVTRLTVTTSHGLTTKDRYMDEFRAADFEIKATYGDFNNAPFGLDSPYLIFIVRKI